LRIGRRSRISKGVTKKKREKRKKHQKPTEQEKKGEKRKSSNFRAIDLTYGIRDGVPRGGAGGKEGVDYERVSWTLLQDAFNRKGKEKMNI